MSPIHGGSPLGAPSTERTRPGSTHDQPPELGKKAATNTPRARPRQQLETAADHQRAPATRQLPLSNFRHACTSPAWKATPVDTVTRSFSVVAGRSARDRVPEELKGKPRPRGQDHRDPALATRTAEKNLRADARGRGQDRTCCREPLDSTSELPKRPRPGARRHHRTRRAPKAPTRTSATANCLPARTAPRHAAA